MNTSIKEIKPYPITIDLAIERLYSLKVGTTRLEEGSPHEKPHKPLLLLAALDLTDYEVALFANYL